MCGDPWLKKGFATSFETWPRKAPISHYFCSSFYWSFQSNFVSFFAGRNAAGCPTEYFLWILNKRPAAGAIFQCLDRRQKELILSIWSPSKNRHYTFKQKHCLFFLDGFSFCLFFTHFFYLFFIVFELLCFSFVCFFFVFIFYCLFVYISLLFIFMLFYCFVFFICFLLSAEIP